jgi:hypothetical protein
LCIRSLDFAKQYAAPTAGVLQGNPGRYMPMKATPNKIQPSVNQNAFLILKFFNILLLSLELRLADTS